VSGCSEPGYILLCTGSDYDRSSRQSIPSLPGKERPGCVAFILAAPPGRCMSDEPARCEHRAAAPRIEMARMLLEVSGNTGLPHPRLLFRESCARAVASPSNTNPAPKGLRTTATLSKGRWSVNPYYSAAAAPAGRSMPPSHSAKARSCRVRARGACLRNAPFNGRRVGARGRRRSLPRRPVAAPRSGRAPVAPGRDGDGRAAR
jgi:hypothetical protein